MLRQNRNKLNKKNSITAKTKNKYIQINNVSKKKLHHKFMKKLDFSQYIEEIENILKNDNKGWRIRMKILPFHLSILKCLEVQSG